MTTLFVILLLLAFSIGDCHRSHHVKKRILHKQSRMGNTEDYHRFPHVKNQVMHKQSRIESTEDCLIDPQISTKSPFVMSLDGSEILYPQQEKDLIIKAGDTVRFACSQGQLQINGILFGKTRKAKCDSKTFFYINHTKYDWNDTECKSPSKATVTPCESYSTSAKFATVGFLFQGKFIEQMSICFDTANKNTLYVHHQIMPQGNTQYPANKSGFIEDPEFFNVGSVKVDNLYRQKKQINTINHLLGVEANSSYYINDTTFFTRGHLAASGDFVYTAQKRATCRFINVAPQLAILNNVIWKNIENDTRNYGRDENITLEVWTGTYGQITVPDVNENKIPLFLYVRENVRGIPIPRWFWKLVYSPTLNMGVVILGYNNPYSPPDIEKICKNVINEITWIKEHESFQEIYLYACSIEEFSKVVNLPPGAPSPSTGLLK